MDTLEKISMTEYANISKPQAVFRELIDEVIKPLQEKVAGLERQMASMKKGKKKNADKGKADKK